MNVDYQLITSVIQNLAVITASVTAILGIRSWRRETKWKRKYELAEEVRTLFYDAQERIHVIRNPISHPTEGKTRKRDPKETEEESKILDDGFIVHERFDREREPFVKLKTLKFRFMVVFGKSSSEPFDELARLMNDILFATNRLGTRYWQDQGRRKFTPEQEEKHLNEMHECESIIWTNHSGEDKVRDRMDQIITKVENICSEVIRAK